MWRPRGLRELGRGAPGGRTDRRRGLARSVGCVPFVRLRRNRRLTRIACCDVAGWLRRPGFPLPWLALDRRGQMSTSLDLPYTPLTSERVHFCPGGAPRGFTQNAAFCVCDRTTPFQTHGHRLRAASPGIACVHGLTTGFCILQTAVIPCTRPLLQERALPAADCPHQETTRRSPWDRLRGRDRGVMGASMGGVITLIREHLAAELPGCVGVDGAPVGDEDERRGDRVQTSGHG